MRPSLTTPFTEVLRLLPPHPSSNGAAMLSWSLSQKRADLGHSRGEQPGPAQKVRGHEADRRGYPGIRAMSGEGERQTARGDLLRLWVRGITWEIIFEV